MNGFRSYGANAGKVARGTPDPRMPSRVQVVCAFDQDTFREIRERALAQGTSFAEQVRLLVEWGLMDAEEDSIKR